MNFRTNTRIISTVMVVLIIVAVIGLNFLMGVLGSKINLNIDLTKEKILKFSDLTKQTIENLETDVKIKSLIPSSSRDDYGIFDSIDLLLKRYDTASDKISYEVVDIVKEPTVFQKYKDKHGNNAPEYSIIFESENGYEVVDTINIFETHSVSQSDPSKQVALFGGEQMFTTALELCAGGAKSNIYVVEGHGEYAMEFSDGLSAGTAAYVEYILKGQPFNVKKINLMEKDIPSDSDLLMVIAPQNDFTDVEVERMDKYLSNGGDAIIMASAFNINANTKNLDEYYKEYGIEFSNGILGENDESKYYNMNGMYYLMPTIEDTEITNAIKSTDGRVATDTSRGIKYESRQNITFTPVLSTSDNTYLFDGEEVTPTSKMNLGVLASEVLEGGKTTNILFLDGPGYLNPAIFSQSSFANLDFVINSAKFLTDSTSALSIVPKDVTPAILAIDESQAKMYSYFVIAVIPFIILAVGFVVWYRRKNLWYQKKVLLRWLLL